MRSCAGCNAPVRVDATAIDVIVPGDASPASWGARAMRSRWLARVYGRWWRPAVFGLSTGLRMPREKDEIRLVLSKLAATRGPWLDLSCGPGTLTSALVAHSRGREVVGLDLSRAMLEHARVAAPRAVLVRADAGALPFADGAFGAVVNLAALDLYSDAARVMSESARVLARGGRWVGSTLLAGGQWPFLSAFQRVAGVRAPTLDELVAWTARAGLDRLETVRFGRYIVAWSDKR
jgi:SAM-dependent methyltransferase